MHRPSLELETHCLGNGLKVVLHPDPALPLVAVNLWVHVGSRNEVPGRTGLAHLFEHLMFQGSAHVGRNEHFQRIQEVGGVANGSTWYDRTNYYETVPSDRLDLALWLESDRLGHFLPALDQEKLDIQRGVVINERQQRVDNQPYGLAWERVFELLYPEGHPYRWPVLGYVPDLEATSLTDVHEFFSRWYAPDNTVLTVAGDFPTDTLQRVEAWFGDIPRGPERPRPDLPAVAWTEDRRDELADDVSLSRTYLAWSIPPYGSDDWYAADVLAAILAGGKSSPLHREMVLDRQIAQDVSAFTFPTEATALFAAVATARPGQPIADCEAAIRKALQRIATRGPEREDLERARARRLVAERGRLQRLEDRADLLSKFATFFGDPAAAIREGERYEAVESEAVRDLAERILGSGAAVLVVRPEETT